jgi:hypothetical protein
LKSLVPVSKYEQKLQVSKVSGIKNDKYMLRGPKVQIPNVAWGKVQGSYVAVKTKSKRTPYTFFRTLHEKVVGRDKMSQGSKVQGSSIIA